MTNFLKPLRPLLPLILPVLIGLCFVCLLPLFADHGPAGYSVWSLGAGLGLGMGMLMKDALVKGTRALPSAASTTVDGAAIDLKHGSFGDFLADCEVKLTAPALTTTMAPDTRTMTYSILHSDNADLSSPTVLYASVIVQTGAGGVGAATTNITVRLPVDVKRYIGARVVSGASIADSSTVSATLELLF